MKGSIPTACWRSCKVPSKQKAPFCGAFAEPSDGLEPSTPSLPWNDSGNRSQPTATVFACLGRFSGRAVCQRLPRVATAGLHKGSTFSCRCWLRRPQLDDQRRLERSLRRRWRLKRTRGGVTGWRRCGNDAERLSARWAEAPPRSPQGSLNAPSGVGQFASVRLGREDARTRVLRGSRNATSMFRSSAGDRYLRTRNRRMVVSPDRLLLSGSSSVFVMPGAEKRTPSPSSTGST
jgi:hypothetical protein